MNQLNSIIIEGNLVRQCALTEPKSGFKVCAFSVAVNRWKRGTEGKDGQEEVSFFNVEAYGKMAEICTHEGSKGRGIRVVGRLKQDRWEENGKTKSRIYIVAEHVEFKPKWDKLSEDSTAATTSATTEENKVTAQAEAEQENEVAENETPETETSPETATETEPEKVPVTADGTEEKEAVNF